MAIHLFLSSAMSISERSFNNPSAYCVLVELKSRRRESSEQPLGLGSFLVAAVRRHENAIASVLILILITTTASVAYLIWQKQYGMLYVNCEAYKNGDLDFPTAIVVNVTSDGRVIGQTSSWIRLLNGQYTLSFPNYLNYQPPENQTVVIEPQNNTYITVSYLERKGYIVVISSVARYFTGTAYIDNQLIGTLETGSHAGDINSFTPEVESGNHTVSIASDYYEQIWKNQTVTVGNCDRVEVDAPYPEINYNPAP